MTLIKKRKCPERGGEMEAKLINLHYRREGADLEVEVIGIPANVCAKCFYRIIPGKVGKHVDSFVDPIFESEKRYKEKILPSPRVGIQFPFLDKDVYAGL